MSEDYEKTKNWDTMQEEERVKLLNWIVDEHQYRKVKSQGHVVTIDAFSAMNVLTVYNNLKKENKSKLMNLPINRMFDISFRLLEKQGKKNGN